jgi:hypothetical protein
VKAVVTGLAALLCVPAASAQVGDPRDHRGTATALCGRYNGSFFVELGGSGSDVGASVYTGGAPIARGGQIMYAFASRGSTRIDYSCRKLAPSNGATTSLRRSERVRHGHYYYARYECLVRGRLIVHVRQLRGGGAYLSVRLEGRRPLLVAATIDRRGGIVRLAPQCVSNPV